MRKVLIFTAGSLFVLAMTSSAAAQLGVDRRIDRRLERRADSGNANAAARLDARVNDPNAWRMTRYNNQWWYYTPQNAWMYYDNNNWTAYDPLTYLPPRQSYVYGNTNFGPGVPGRYYTGYRGFWGPPANPPVANFGANVGANTAGVVDGSVSGQTGAAVGGAIDTRSGNIGGTFQPNVAAPNTPANDGTRSITAPQQPQTTNPGGQQQPAGQPPAAGQQPAAGNQPAGNASQPAPAAGNQSSGNTSQPAPAAGSQQAPAPAPSNQNPNP